MWAVKSMGFAKKWFCTVRHVRLLVIDFTLQSAFFRLVINTKVMIECMLSLLIMVQISMLVRYFKFVSMETNVFRAIRRDTRWNSSEPLTI